MLLKRNWFSTLVYTNISAANGWIFLKHLLFLMFPSQRSPVTYTISLIFFKRATMRQNNWRFSVKKLLTVLNRVPGPLWMNYNGVVIPWCLFWRWMQIVTYPVKWLSYWWIGTTFAKIFMMRSTDVGSLLAFRLGWHLWLRVESMFILKSEWIACPPDLSSGQNISKLMAFPSANLLGAQTQIRPLIILWDRRWRELNKASCSTSR